MLLRRNVPWNLSSLGRSYRRADGFVVSIPKCGRTWLRVLFCAYACKRAGRDVEVGTDLLRALGAPDVRFTHDAWEHRTTRAWDRVRGKHLLAPADRRKPIVLLARDPRDVIVSLYLQLAKRELRFRGTLTEFLRDREFGLAMIVDVMNRWWAEWGATPNVRLFRYEECRARTAAELSAMLAHLGFRDVDAAVVAAAVEYSRFENMQRMEREGKFDAGYLKPTDAADPESFKVRRGKIGGYRDYLDADDVAYVERVCAELAPAYGYGQPAG
jgi:hypothetical protein